MDDQEVETGKGREKCFPLFYPTGNPKMTIKNSKPIPKRILVLGGLDSGKS